MTDATAAIAIDPGDTEMLSLRDRARSRELDQRSRTLTEAGDLAAAVDVLKQAIALRLAGAGLGMSPEEQEAQDRRLAELKVAKALRYADTALSKRDLSGALIDQALSAIEDVDATGGEKLDIVKHGLYNAATRPGMYWGRIFDQVKNISTSDGRIEKLSSISNDDIFMVSAKGIRQISLASASTKMFLPIDDRSVRGTSNAGTPFALASGHKLFGVSGYSAEKGFSTIRLFSYPDAQPVGDLLVIGSPRPRFVADPMDMLFLANGSFIAYDFRDLQEPITLWNVADPHRPRLLQSVKASRPMTEFSGVTGRGALGIVASNNLLVVPVGPSVLNIFQVGDGINLEKPSRVIRLKFEGVPIQIDDTGRLLALNGYELTGDRRRKIFVIDLNTAEIVRSTPMPPYKSFALSPSLEALIVCPYATENSVLDVIDIESGQSIRKLHGNTPSSTIAWIAAQPQFVAGADDGSLTVWGVQADTEEEFLSLAPNVTAATQSASSSPSTNLDGGSDAAKSMNAEGKFEVKTPNLAARDAVPQVDSKERVVSVKTDVWRMSRQSEVRAQPSLSAPVLATIPTGALVQVLDAVPPDGKWLRVAEVSGQGFLLAEAAAPAGEPSRELQGNVAIIDTATLNVDGSVVRLDGILGVSGDAASRMQSFVAEQGGVVSCIRRTRVNYSCKAGKTDLAEAALLNGAARTTANAPDSYRKREQQARASHRGIWSQ